MEIQVKDDLCLTIEQIKKEIQIYARCICNIEEELRAGLRLIKTSMIVFQVSLVGMMLCLLFIV